MEAAWKKWRAEQKEHTSEYWREYWRRRSLGVPDSKRLRIPRAVRETPFWREQMRKAIKRVLRKDGIRARNAGNRDSDGIFTRRGGE